MAKEVQANKDNEGNEEVHVPEVIPNDDVFSVTDLSSIGSFDDLMGLAGADGLEASSGEEILTGFERKLEKRKLVGEWFDVVEWKFVSGGAGFPGQSEEDAEIEAEVSEENPDNEFVYLTVIVKETGQKGFLTDGGYGIYKSLKDITAKRRQLAKDGKSKLHPQALLRVPGGLRERPNKPTKDNPNPKPSYLLQFHAE